MTIIQYDSDKNKLTIQAKDWNEGNVLMGLPSRRWLPTKGVFVVPLTKINARLLLEAEDKGDIGTGELRGLLQERAFPKTGTRAWPVDFPFMVTPFPDQLAACNKLYSCDTFALLMRPGSGKSKVAIDLFNKFYQDGLIDLAIVICPLTVAPVWLHNEIAKHSHHYNVELWNTNGGTFPPDTNRGLSWLIIGIEALSQGRTFERLQKLLEVHYRKVAMLIDESHTIKNTKTLRTKRAIELGKKAVVRAIATGTWVTKNLIDLYSQFEFLDPNIIGVGDYYAFRNRYCMMGGYKNKEIVGYNNVEELMGMIEPFIFYCDKPKGLPPKLYQSRIVKMTADQRDLYRRVKNAEIEGISVANILNRIIKLQQIVGGFLLKDPVKTKDPVTGREHTVAGVMLWSLPSEHNPKLQALREILEEAGDDQVVVWCKYLWEIEEVRDLLEQRGEVGVLIGEASVWQRSEIQRKFQDGTIRYIVGNQQTGGVGITLTAAHLCIYYSNGYSFSERIQSEDRLHRIGQENDVLYVDLIMEKSVDRIVEAALKEKIDLDAYIARMLAAGASLETMMETDT